MNPKIITRLSPYTGNWLHTVYMVRKTVNGHNLGWKQVVWECQNCLRTHGNPSWCCPKCGGYAIYKTEEEMKSVERVEKNRSRHEARESVERERKRVGRPAKWSG